ncbi:hypothetical protein V1264_023015 [Littorina saxatilis]|uniref:PUL domain-containing protein n=1 Tax=Littorina saxatilis TaxID=31220 RepID=A0AAN9BAI8_9CAEN
MKQIYLHCVLISSLYSAGSGSYKPAGGQPAAANPGNNYFPVKNFLALDTGNPKQILGKLQEFNKVIPAEKQVDEAALNSLEQLMAGRPTEASVAALQRILEWPADKLFPGLDVLRLGVKHAIVSRHFAQLPDFLTFLCLNLVPGSSTPNVMLSIRAIANMFSQPEGVKLMTDNQLQVLPVLTGCEGVTNKNAQIAQSTAVLNFSIAATNTQDFERKSECATAAATLLTKELDSEAVFRLLVALGTLCHGDEMCQAVLQSVDFTPVLQKLREKSDLNKVIECADILLKS